MADKGGNKIVETICGAITAVAGFEFVGAAFGFGTPIRSLILTKHQEKVNDQRLKALEIVRDGGIDTENDEAIKRSITTQEIEES